MGSVAVLLPTEDILKIKTPLSHPHHHNQQQQRRTTPPPPPHRSRRHHNNKKRSQSRSPPPDPDPDSDVGNTTSTSSLMGQIRILKRGEPLTGSPTPTPPPLTRVPSQTPILTRSSFGRIKKGGSAMINGFYAGTGFMESSPPPSSLPMPAMIGNNKKNSSNIVGSVDRDQKASIDLRRILQLD